MNFSPLHSRFFSSSVSIWDEKLNIFGQIFLVCTVVWLVILVKLLTISILLWLSSSDWLSSPKCNKNSEMSSFVVSGSDVISLLVGLFVTMGRCSSNVLMGLQGSILFPVFRLVCVVVIRFVLGNSGLRVLGVLCMLALLFMVILVYSVTSLKNVVV